MDDLFLLGLRILVLYHMGILEQGVKYKNIQFKVPAKISEDYDYQFNDEDPSIFISIAVLDFFDEYLYYETHPNAAPSYKDVNPLFWLAEKEYNRLKNIIEISKLQSDNKESDDDRSALHKRFNLKG